MAKFNISNILYKLIITAILLSSSGCNSSKEIKSFSTPELKIRIRHEKSLSEAKVLVIEFNISDGWHIYGPHAQKNGRPVTLELNIDNNKVNNIIWPETVTFDEGKSGKSEGYAGNIQVSSVIPDISKKAQADISWVACKDLCVPGQAKLELDLK